MSTKTHRVCSNPESLRDLNSWKEDGPVDVHYYVSGVREFRARMICLRSKVRDLPPEDTHFAISIKTTNDTPVRRWLTVNDVLANEDPRLEQFSFVTGDPITEVVIEQIHTDYEERTTGKNYNCSDKLELMMEYEVCPVHRPPRKHTIPWTLNYS